MKLSCLATVLVVILMCSCVPKDEITYDGDFIDSKSGVWKYNPTRSPAPEDNNLGTLSDFNLLVSFKAPTNTGDGFFEFSRNISVSINELRGYLENGEIEWTKNINTIYVGLRQWNAFDTIKINNLQAFYDYYDLSYSSVIKLMGDNNYKFAPINNSFDISLCVGSYKWLTFYKRHINKRSIKRIATLDGDILNDDESNVLPYHIDNENGLGFKLSSSEEKGKDEIFINKMLFTNNINSLDSYGIIPFLALLDDINVNKKDAERFKSRKTLLNPEYNTLGGYYDYLNGIAVIRFKNNN